MTMADSGRIQKLEQALTVAREALKRHRQGMRNILEFRKISGTGSGINSRYGSLTRDEIEKCIGEIDAALRQAEIDRSPQPPKDTNTDTGRQCQPIILGKCIGFIGGSMDHWPEICDRCGFHFNLHQAPENAGK